MGDKFDPKFDARGFVQKTGHFFMQKKTFRNQGEKQVEISEIHPSIKKNKIKNKIKIIKMLTMEQSLFTRENNFT